MKKIIVFIMVFIFSNILLQAQTETHRIFAEIGWVQPYGAHLGFGIGYFYGGFNIFFNEKESITLHKKYYEYSLNADGSINYNAAPKYLEDEDEEITSMGKSTWIQFPLGVQLDIVKKRNFIFSIREAWIPSIISVEYDNELYRPDKVLAGKQLKTDKAITHLFWDDGLRLLSERRVYHAFYPLCFETTFQFVFNGSWTISLGAILDGGFIERSRFSISFGISNSFGL